MNTNKRATRMLSVGRTRYILYFGVLGWGLLSAILFTVWNLYTKETLSAAAIIVPFVTFPLCGILWGAAMWAILTKHDGESAVDAK